MGTEEVPERAPGAWPFNRMGEERSGCWEEGVCAEFQGPWELFGAV